MPATGCEVDEVRLRGERAEEGKREDQQFGFHKSVAVRVVGHGTFKPGDVPCSQVSLDALPGTTSFGFESSVMAPHRSNHPHRRPLEPRQIKGEQASFLFHLSHKFAFNYVFGVRIILL